ncbi:MAG: adenylate kinase [Oscillospiraceae bacterium]
MRVMLLGAPGAGKGTLAEILSNKLSIPIIGTGNIIRDAIQSGSELGKQFSSYTDSGRLVPDELVVEMVADRLQSEDCKNGYIFDGFPRTTAQAEAFAQMGGTVDAVISLEAADDAIVARMAGRRVCAKCGTPYHITNMPSKVPGVCDRCGGELMIRKDDAPATVRERLVVYHEQTEPLVNFYRSHSKLVKIDAMQGIEHTAQCALEALGVRLV